MVRCRHCRRKKANRPRGLCWTCYYTPGVRARFGVKTCNATKRGIGHVAGRRPLPPMPTNTTPGSAERLAVLAERAVRGESLWHPADAVIAHAPMMADGPRVRKWHPPTRSG